MTPKTLFIFALAAVSVAAHAQTALDRGSDAAYADGWTAGDNGGFGFGAWTVANGDPTYGGSVGISNVPALGGASFALASGGGQYSGAEARRPFGVPLGTGSVFSFDFAQAALASPQGDGSFGIVLLNAAGKEMTSTFGYFYNQFGLTPTNDTFVSSSSGNLDSGIDYTATGGLHVAFAVTSDTTFTVGLGAVGTVPTYTTTGTFKNTGPITGIRLFSYQASATAPLTVNNLVVQSVPEPATLAALGLGLVALSRRRR